MIRAYTPAQIRVAEHYFLQRAADGVLMRRAAWQVAAAVLRELMAGSRPPLLGPPLESLPERYLARSAGPRAATRSGLAFRSLSGPGLPGRSVVLLVGAGNNGGDALFAGAALRRRGLVVTAVCLDPARVHRGGRAALERAGGRFVAADNPRVPSLVGQADAIVDGIVGLGARPPLRHSALALIAASNAANGRRIAVDLPSGVDPGTGCTPTVAFDAHRTVTMGGHKTGLLLCEQAGLIDLAEIGMDPARCDPPVEVDALALGADDLVALLPRPTSRDNKFTLGVTGIVAGSSQYPGAALLTVGGAVSTRPGLVRYAGPRADDIVGRWPEVVATVEIDAAGRVQAWVVGPGMGTGGAPLRRLRDVLSADVPVLVDADGLTLLSQHPELLADRVRRGRTTVLTPHAGEFARLFPDIDPAAGRVAAVRAAAARSGAVILLKGNRTVIGNPAGRVYVNTTGTPQLATAGSGDVLSGIIGAMLSARLDALDAAALGAHLHGLAARRAAGRAGASALVHALAETVAAQVRPDVVPSGM